MQLDQPPARVDLNRLPLPIIQAPMAGGASTPALAAAVSAVGGLGFLAAGYRAVEALGDDLAKLRRLSSAAFGVNLFAAPAREADRALVEDYALRLRTQAARHGVTLGEPRFDDDGLQAKLDLLVDQRVEVVSFTFGCPGAEVVALLHQAGCDVWVTVTTPAEARVAEAAGADALVLQGLEAGGHRGAFLDEGEEFGLLALLRLVAADSELPLVAAGAIMDGAAVAAVLCAGASAAQLGSALLLTDEAATSPAHRAAIGEGRPTRITRAFTGRPARGLVNRFMEEHDAHAPEAYPQVHHLTSPLRAAARAAGDGEAINLWAGQAHTLARAAPAGQVVRDIAAEASAVLADVRGRLGDAKQGDGA